MSTRGRIITPLGLMEFVTETCCNCDVPFAMTREMYKRRLEDGKPFWCPAGHRQWYSGPSPEERLKRELERARAQVTHWRDQHDASERSRRALRGVNTRMRNRVANGVCPCCNRQFPDLQAHMETKHPEYVGSEKQA